MSWPPKVRRPASDRLRQGQNGGNDGERAVFLLTSSPGNTQVGNRGGCLLLCLLSIKCAVDGTSCRAGIAGMARMDRVSNGRMRVDDAACHDNRIGPCILQQSLPSRSVRTQAETAKLEAPHCKPKLVMGSKPIKDGPGSGMGSALDKLPCLLHPIQSTRACVRASCHVRAGGDARQRTTPTCCEARIT